jgi:uncharacterized protein (TIGR00730 family)
MMRIICAYAGSSDLMHADYLVAARQMGRAIAERGITLAYGAGCTGLMGALADGALEVGGEVIGVIPEMFNSPQLMHNRLSHLEIVESMHQRKARLIEISDAFIALPGGYGTFEELFEILTWAQIGLHRKPVGLLNARHYFDPLLALINHAQQEGFIYKEHRQFISVDEHPDTLLDTLATHRYPAGLERWVLRED